MSARRAADRAERHGARARTILLGGSQPGPARSARYVFSRAHLDRGARPAPTHTRVRPTSPSNRTGAPSAPVREPDHPDPGLRHTALRRSRGDGRRGDHPNDHSGEWPVELLAEYGASRAVEDLLATVEVTVEVWRDGQRAFVARLAIYVNFIVTGNIGKSRRAGWAHTSHVARRKESLVFRPFLGCD